MKLTRIKYASLAVGTALALGVAPAARAQSADALLDLLTKKGVISQREANDVREQLDAQTAQAVEAYSKTKASTWLDSLKFSGDLRLRTEFFDNEDQSNKTDRLRFRYRLRLQVDAQMTSWTKVGFRLASGSGDALSTNETLTDSFKKKPITIDAAFVTIQRPGWDWISVTAGKMDNAIWQPKFNSPLVYDGDLTPEGVVEQISVPFGDKQQYRVFANVGQYVLEELSSASYDSYMYDFQAGMEAWFGGDAKNPRLKMTGAVGYYTTANIVNSGSLFGDNSSKNVGNAAGSGSLTNNYLADFNVINVRGEVAYLLSERPFLGTPVKLTVSGEYDKNLQNAYRAVAGDQTDAWTIQAMFGEAKKKGQWQVAYQYKYLEADAVWDAITDSDWGTDGGTDRKGHVIKGAYNILDWWQLSVGAFVSEKISNRPTSGAGASHNMKGIAGQDLLRIQVDSVFKF